MKSHERWLLVVVAVGALLVVAPVHAQREDAQHADHEVTAADFEGLFETTYGRMRLACDGDRVTGIYSYGGGSTIQGTVKEGRLEFRYQEPTVAGEGWFELAEDGDRFTGRWRENGAQEWSSWTGRRIEPQAGVVWLVVLEAPWETSLAEQEYAFGEMLRTYFARMPHVHVRHRRFYDVEDFERLTRELAYLAEPVGLLLASHGDTNGLTVNGQTIGADELTEALAPASNVFVVHFSACAVMGADVPDEILNGMPPGRRLAISGYAVPVDWSASAILEFLYLDLVLGRRVAPARAAELIEEELAFSGDEGVDGSPLGAAHFRFVETEDTEPAASSAENRRLLPGAAPREQ